MGMENFWHLTDFAPRVSTPYQCTLHVLNDLRRRSDLVMAMTVALLVPFENSYLGGSHCSNTMVVHWVKTAS